MNETHSVVVVTCTMVATSSKALVPLDSANFPTVSFHQAVVEKYDLFHERLIGRKELLSYD
jgi:hypothetical protein